MRFLIFIFLILTTSLSDAQSFNYTIGLDAVKIEKLGGLQSFSFGQSDGKWLIIGGRLDGLHRRQPWAAFNKAGHNTLLFVVDPIAKKQWSMPDTLLSPALKEQLSSTNMEFYQEGEILYLIGGYGFSATKNDHITFPSIIACNVSEIMQSIIAGIPLKNEQFHQIIDEKFAVTGGQLQRMNGLYYLIGGHRFDGRYNPMNNPTFEQTYTNQVRIFELGFSDQQLKYRFLDSMYSHDLMHRRDFNVLPQIDRNGTEKLTAFSGVFQEDLDIPYINAIEIADTSMHAIPRFAQYYNHYHCASVSLFDRQKQQQHFLFFGGIANYYDSLSLLVMDTDVPFVSTISRISVAANGELAEYKIPLNMPGFLGAASEFIPNPLLPKSANDVLLIDDFQSDSLLLGYIFGGIKSSAAAIFWTNTGNESNANAFIYPVYLMKSSEKSNDQLNTQSNNGLQLQVFADAFQQEVNVQFMNLTDGISVITIQKEDGTTVLNRKIRGKLNKHSSEYFTCKKLKSGQRYRFIYSNDALKVEQWLNVH
jgi:hypothetical protein